MIGVVGYLVSEDLVWDLRELFVLQIPISLARQHLLELTIVPNGEADSSGRIVVRSLVDFRAMVLQTPQIDDQELISRIIPYVDKEKALTRV